MCKKLFSQAEQKWFALAESFIRPLYEGHWMPAHNFQHHIRVWKYACQVAEYLQKFESAFYEKLLLACLFHDVGMLYDRSEKHGWKSRELCEGFLRQHNTHLHFSYEDLLEAVEYHDDKEYKQVVSSNSVYSILCIADDLDAFGAIGVYRYAEIYWQRGIPIGDIPGQVLINATKRYMNIENQLGNDYLMQTLAREHFNTLLKLFETESFDNSAQTMVEWLVRNVFQPELYIFKQSDEIAMFANTENSRIKYFMKSFQAEMLNLN